MITNRQKKGQDAGPHGFNAHGKLIAIFGIHLRIKSHKYYSFLVIDCVNYAWNAGMTHVDIVS